MKPYEALTVEYNLMQVKDVYELCLQLVVSLTAAPSSGYDAGYTTCSKPYRSSKSRSEIPCNFRNQNWCTIPGSAYPWLVNKQTCWFSLINLIDLITLSNTKYIWVAQWQSASSIAPYSWGPRLKSRQDLINFVWTWLGNHWSSGF